MVNNHIWAMEQHALNSMLADIRNGIDAEKQAEQQAMVTKRIQGVRGDIAVLALHGTITQHDSLLSSLLGGTTTDRFSAEFDRAVNSDQVGAVLIHIHSGGGSTFGVQELSDQIFAARSKKLIVAVADSVAASAAFWLGSAATKFFVTPGGEVGSIGVFSVHEDISMMEEQAGIKTTLISAGEHKVDGNPFEPLTEEAKARIQTEVDFSFNQFVTDVARNRGVSKDVVTSQFGGGNMMMPPEAMKVGAVDGIDTFKNVFSRLSQRTNNRSRNRASMEVNRRRGCSGCSRKIGGK